MRQPLGGIRVLDLGQIYQGPYCGTLLAYLGADVVKVEPPWGENVRSRSEDGTPPQVQYLNPNKRGITLDLTTEVGRKTMIDLVGESDVLIENYTTNTMADLDLGYETLRETNPRLVYAHGSGYGDDGPYAEYPAMDLTIQAMSGVMHTTGYPDTPPVKAGPAICDFLGGVHLAVGVVSALFEREFTGEGGYVEVGMFDCMIPTLASPVAAWVDQTDAPPRTGNQHSGLAIAPYNAYEVIDGYVAIICIAERHWEALARIMDRENLIGAERFSSKVDRANHIEEIDGYVEAWLAGKTRDEAVETLLSNGVPCAPVRTIEEIVDDPHLNHRGMLHYLPNQSEKGRREIPVPGSPIKFSNGESPATTPAPRLGEHTETVLTEVIGYSDEDIETLRDAGAI